MSNRGAISGGYQDAGRSRMINMKMLREAQKVRAELRKESAQVKDELQAAEQAVTAVLGDIQRMEFAATPQAHGGRAARVESKTARTQRPAPRSLSLSRRRQQPPFAPPSAISKHRRRT